MNTQKFIKRNYPGSAAYIVKPKILILFFVLVGFKLQLFSRQTEYEIPGVKDNLPVFYKKLPERQVWDSQNAGNNLITKLYDSPHEFNLMMQDDAFTWLDKLLQNAK
jgi:hypothetical protein